MSRRWTVPLVVVAFFLGALLNSYMTAGFVPVRNADGCAALNTETGKVVGSFSARNGRCELRDWRIWHPFG